MITLTTLAGQELQTARKSRNKALKFGLAALGLIAILEGYHYHKTGKLTIPHIAPSIFLAYNAIGAYVFQKDINKINRIKIEGNTITLPPNHYSIK